MAVTDLTPVDRAPAPRDRELSAAVWDRTATFVTAALDTTNLQQTARGSQDDPPN